MVNLTGRIKQQLPSKDFVSDCLVHVFIRYQKIFANESNRVGCTKDSYVSADMLPTPTSVTMGFIGQREHAPLVPNTKEAAPLASHDI